MEADVVNAGRVRMKKPRAANKPASRADRGSIAADVQAALRELQDLAAAVRLGRIARTIAATTGHTPADVAQLLSYAIAVIEEGLADEDPKKRRNARGHLRRFQKLLEIESRIAQCDRLLQRAKVTAGRESHPSKAATKNGLKRSDFSEVRSAG
jgi:hypothetical protein